VKLGLLLLAGGVWGVFTAAVPLFFRQPPAVHPRMRLLAALGLAQIALTLTVLVRATLAVESAIVAAALYVLALALFAWACLTVGRRQLSLAYCEPGTADLIVTGPYGVVRHPIYAAYTCAWLAGAIAARSVVLLAGALVMWRFYLDAARREEAWLASTGGARYARYRTAVGMFLPTLRRHVRLSSQE
jgi:protein-S-isoprenylcysteine O-methyltransferase Ste14